MGLLWHGFHDAVKEADRDIILNYWKFLLVLFKSTNHHNYSKEAVNLLLQYYYKLSERQKAQLLWSRVNTKGLPGCNVPCDLHMEHLNRRLKKVIHSMGANVRPSAIVKAGKALGPVDHLCQVFEQETSHSRQSNYHPVPGFGKDLDSFKHLRKSEGFCSNSWPTTQIV